MIWIVNSTINRISVGVKSRRKVGFRRFYLEFGVFVSVDSFLLFDCVHAREFQRIRIIVVRGWREIRVSLFEFVMCGD